jgi:hypothetical protein
MVISKKKSNQKNHVSFMPYAFTQSEHRSGQCGHFSQVEHFEKSWFLIVKCAIVASEGFFKLPLIFLS